MTTLDIETLSIQPLLVAWEQRFVAVPDREARIPWLRQAISEMKAELLKLGAAADAQLPKENGTIEPANFEAAFICYEWANQAKVFLLLMRDVLFEQQKSDLLLLDELHSEKALDKFWKQSIEALNQAFLELKSQSDVEKNKATHKRQLKQWKHQENPWNLYKKQLDLIDTQALELAKDYDVLHQVQALMQEIENVLDQTLESNWKHLNSNQGCLDQVLGILSLSSIEAAEKPNQILQDLHHVTGNLIKIGDIDVFKEKLDALLKDHGEKIEPVVRIKGSLLERRGFHPQEEIFAWLDAAIFPLLFEIFEVSERGTSGLKMVLSNLINRMEILTKENSDMELLKNENLRLQKPLINYSKDLNNILDNIAEVTALVNNRMEQFFKLSSLFDTQKYFLPVSLQSTINRKFWNSENGWWSQLVTQAQAYKQKFDHYRKKLTHYHGLSTSERLAAAIQSRKKDTGNSHYASIFLTKGYVGESFIVGREEEMQRFDQVVQNWKEGFRGSVLVYGDRFSGKTVFGEIVARRYFANNFYRLQPNSVINIQGRKYQTTVDLKEALSFVLKHLTTEHPMIFIDDLELWWSDKVPFFQNLHHLSESIDHYSNKVFFLVSMNSRLKQQAVNFCELDRVFQSQIDFNQLSKEAFQEAISIRHGATHKKLVHANGEILTSQEFSKLVSKLHKMVEGNVGEGLNRWVNSTSYIDENSIACSLNTYQSLPVFLQDDSALIIEILLKYKKSNEYQLRQLFGKAFGMRYAALVLRLMNTHVLRRQLDGSIEIEPTIVNELQQIMD